MQILVTGASGILGSRIADALEGRGHDVRRASRTLRPGWVVLDLASSGDLVAACDDVDAIVHCAADPFGKADAVERDALVALRHAAPGARIVYPSIVGCDRIGFAYYRAKARAEQALIAAGGDHAILRITQFHEFADRLARLPLPVVPMAMRTQVISADEAATALADVVEGDVQGLVGDIGGPEVHRMVDLIKQRMQADGRRRPVIRLPLGTRGFRAGYNLCPDAVVGTTTWAEHLAATP